MPIILGVRTELDERSLDDVRRTTTSAFDGLGKDLGGVLETGIRSSLSGALSGATSELGAFGKVAESSMSGLVSGAGAAALGIGGIVVAAAAVGRELYNLAVKWDDIGDSITGATGKMGAELDGIVRNVQQVSKESTLAANEIANFAGGVTASMHLSGDAAQRMTQQLSDIKEVTNQIVDTKDLSKFYRMFDIDGVQQQHDRLNDLLAVSQSLQIPINQVIDNLLKVGPSAREAGLGLGETISAMLALEESGVDVDKFAAQMTAFMRRQAADGKDASQALEQVVTQIKALIDAGRDADAEKLAFTNFGRAAQDVFKAIKDGTFDVQKLHEGMAKLGDTKDLIEKQKAATEDWDASWTKLKNNLEGVFAPTAKLVLDGVNASLGSALEQTRQLIEFFSPTNQVQMPTGPSGPLPPGYNPTNPLGVFAPVKPSAAVPNAPGNPLDTLFPGAPGPGGSTNPLNVFTPPGSTGPDLTALYPALGPIAPGAPPGGWPATPPKLGTVGGTMGQSWGLGSGGGFYDPWWAKNNGGSGGSGDLTPYGPGYGAGPNPGETAEQYRARMAQLEADHRVSEAEAKLNQMRTGGAASAEQIQKAENDLAEARTRQYQLQLQNSQLKPGSIDVAIPYAPEFGLGPNPGETSQQYSARSALMEAQHKAAEEYAKLRQMESSGVATQNEIINQKNKVLEAQRAQQAAEMRLNDAYSKQVEDATKGMDALGAGLDKDLGLSKGLAGLADNLVRFLGNLAAAPLMGQLNAISAAQGGPSATGSGFIGMLAAQGAFGPEYQMAGMDSSGKPYSMAAAMGGPGMGGAGGPGTRQPLSINQVDQLAAQFGLTKTSGYRNEPGSYHSTGQAGDYAGTPEQMDAFANFMATNYGSDLNELIHSGSGTQYNVYKGQLGPPIDQAGSVYNSGQAGYHGDHDHIAVGNRPAMQNFAPAGMSAKDRNAMAIIQEGQRRGLSRSQIEAALGVAMQETDLGTNPMTNAIQNQNGTPGIQGMFQQDNSYNQYGDKTDPSVAARGFIDQFIARGGMDSPNPWGFAVHNVQKPALLGAGGYDDGTGAYLRNRWGGSASDYFNRLNGPATFDDGGVLMPGITIAQNNTGKPEHVVTPEQVTAIGNFGKAMAPNPMSGTPSENVGTGATQIGGTEPKSQSGASAGGGGGLFGAAVGAGAMAADAFAPGSGAAVQIAGQEIQRAIKAGGQFAGIVAGGLMETFLPAGASQIANDNWITRVGGAFAGLAPQLPNLAGKAPTPVPNKAPGQPAMPVFPGAPGTDKPKDGASPTFNVTLNANGPIEDKHVDQMTGALQRQYETGMAQVGGR